jgi:branched-chain amino acid transport system permease protein
VVIAIGLNFILGYAGMFAFAHGAFMGVGAYASALLSAKLGFHYVLSLLSAGVLAGAVGCLVGIPAIRVSGLYLAMVTLAFSELVLWVVKHWKSVTNGADGVSIPAPSFLTWQFRSDTANFYIILVVTFVMIAWARRILQSKLGRSFVALRDGEMAARCNGIDVPLTKTIAFGLSAFYAGVGGVLFAQTQHYIAPDSFGLFQTILHFCIVVVGGTASLAGSIIGAVLLTALPELLRNVQALQEIGYGVLLLVFVIFAPRGIAGTLRQMGWLRREAFVAPGSIKIVDGPEPGNRPKPQIAQGYSTRPLLQIERLSVKFDGLVASDNVDLRINRGEIHGLIGPNGAGKTTLFNTISGLVVPATGKIIFDGEDVTALPAHTRATRGIRRTFQSVQLVQSFTTCENVLVGLHAEISYNPMRMLADPSWRGGISPDEVRRIFEVLRYLEIEHLADREVGSLNIAEQRLVEIAQALVSRPKLVLLDEPSAGLTPHQIERLDALLVKLRDDWGIAILLVEHLVSLVVSVCGRVTVLDRGKVIAEDEAAAIVASPAVRAAYLGEDVVA